MNEIFSNPILPDYEYIQSEIHVFGDRVYIYGSHDEFNGSVYCENDYVTWSASVTDLTSWKYEGIIYKKADHHFSPLKKGKSNLYAPDVAKGPDGKYYLYYSAADSGIISVALSDCPTGPFSYYGDVKAASGYVYGENSKQFVLEFDPAVLVDGEKVYLYSGSGQKANEKNGHPVVGLSSENSNQTC
ncbi:MAG: family 43 glycosylhydrolase [Alkalibacterium sp.]|nr:family 43 glycosylhydrolase [Alkalibacterium sp.]